MGCGCSKHSDILPTASGPHRTTEDHGKSNVDATPSEKSEQEFVAVAHVDSALATRHSSESTELPSELSFKFQKQEGRETR